MQVEDRLRFISRVTTVVLSPLLSPFECGRCVSMTNSSDAGPAARCDIYIAR